MLAREVSSFCLGAMMFGASGNTDHDESIEIIHGALDGGISFIGTADVDGAGESEEIFGQALAGGRRDDVVLVAKFHNPKRRCRRSASSSTRARSATSAPRPAITSLLTGPSTMEQLETQLAAADAVLSDDVLDRIDEIVPPGTTINPADSSFDTPRSRPQPDTATKERSKPPRGATASMRLRLRSAGVLVREARARLLLSSAGSSGAAAGRQAALLCLEGAVSRLGVGGPALLGAWGAPGRVSGHGHASSRLTPRQDGHQHLTRRPAGRVLHPAGQG